MYLQCIPEMNFKGRGFQKLQHYRQTDIRCDWK